MKKVLIAVEGTAGTKSVLSVYKAMVQEPEDVILVHVHRLEGKSLTNNMLREPNVKGMKESTRRTEDNEELDRKSENITSFYKKELENGGSVKVKALVREGIPSEEILKIAHDEKVDLIIMGRNGNSGLRRFFAGCVTKEVERGATVPVLVAKTAGHEKFLQYGWRKAYAAW